MCYVSPGPRCTPHARAKMNTANRKVKVATEKLNEVSKEIASREEALTNDGNGFGYQETLLDTNDVMANLRARKAAATVDLRNARSRAKEAIREFAGTKGGQAELEERLDAAKQAKDVVKAKNYERTLKEGAAIAGWRENALIKMREDGLLPISKSRMYHSDGSHKFYPDEIGISTDKSDVGGDIQVGDTHSVRFESADRLVQVTPMAYAVALDDQGQALNYDERDKASAWSYQVSTDYIAYENAHERDHNGAPAQEDLKITNHYGKRFGSLEDADAGALEHIQSLAPEDISWKPGVSVS